VKVRIPAGVDDGQRIRIKGRGEPGRNGGPAGDLFVTVHVTPHPLFGRRGRDLTLTVPVTFPEVTLGATITVPSLNKPVTLRVPPGTKTGRTFRVRGHGLHSGGQSGDLLVTVEVVVPTELNDAQRKAVQALADATSSSPRTDLGV
jgi:molecular chaperone DnaJ